MAPTVHSAKLTLSCPLFAADFDPRNNGRLLVGGGGGEGRSGVGNKIVSAAALFMRTLLITRVSRSLIPHTDMNSPKPWK